MKKIVLLALSMMLLFTGCQKKETGAQKGATAQGGKEGLTVVTSFYPIYLLAENVVQGVDGVTLKNMASPQTGCLHDYQLSTQDMKLLEEADVFFVNGGGMERFLDKAVATYPKLDVADTSRGIWIQDDDDRIEDDHDYDEETEKYEEEHDHDDEENPHIWLSMSNAVKQAENICETMVRLDPKNEETYRKNTEQFGESLKALMKQTNEFALGEKKEVGIFHEGFGYFAEAFGFEDEICIFVDDNETPSSKVIADAIAEAKAEKITVFFAADDSGKEIAQTIAEEVGGKVYVLDPITTGELKADAYRTAMEKNVATIKEALK